MKLPRVAPFRRPCAATLAIAAVIALAPVARAGEDFKLIENLARAYFLAHNSVRPADIRSVYSGTAEGGLPNTRQIEMTADVTIRLKNGTVSRLQLYQKAGQWTVARDLGGDVLAEAHAQLVDEVLDPVWRETHRLQQIMALELETRLRRAGKLPTVQKVYPRCFVNLRFSKALCDVWYSTWTSDEPECFDDSVLFTRKNDGWQRIPGAFHTGQRISPDTGEIFEMQPRPDCAKK